METHRDAHLFLFFAIIFSALLAVTTTYAASSPVFYFPENLRLRDTGSDVLQLQTFLNGQGFILAQTGPGSPGKETTLFGAHTYRALQRYQEAHNLPSTGFFGPLTRAFISDQSLAAPAGANPNGSSTTQQPQGIQSNGLSVYPPPLLFPIASPGFGGGGGASPTPSADTTPPAISSISSGTPGIATATTTWMTDEAATSQVEYGTTSSYGATTTLDSTLTKTHSVLLSGLTASTTYHFRTRSADAAGNLTVSSDYTFTTATAPDITPPTVSQTAPTGGATVSGTSVNLSATASDNVAVAGVTFKVNGVIIGAEDTSAPYSVTWDSTASRARQIDIAKATSIERMPPDAAMQAP
jgi:hypothetical protein